MVADRQFNWVATLKLTDDNSENSRMCLTILLSPPDPSQQTWFLRKQRPSTGVQKDLHPYRH